jgi:hypothetical protein
MPDPTSFTSPSAIESATAPNEQLKFELFPKLPPELRLKIWNLAPESRVIEVIFKQDHRKNNYKFLATTPAILHANHEARVEGLRRYKHVFKTKWALNGVFFDFEIDVLYFSRSAGDSQKNLFLRKVKHAELVKVQNFAGASWDVSDIALFPGLKELMFLCPKSFNRRPMLGAHDCGVARGDIGIHEIESLMAQYPDQQYSLSEALSHGKTFYAQSVARCKRWQTWREPEGHSVVYAMMCDNGDRQRFCDL